MEEILREIRARRARRALSERPVEAAAVARIMAAAVYAPSCFNNQPWRFVVVRDAEVLETVKAGLSGGNYWARRSPLIVLAVTGLELDCRLNGGRDYAFFDLGLAVGNLVTQATAEGLYAHPIAGYKPDMVKAAAGIPEDHILLTMVILGYPGDESSLNDEHRAAEHEGRRRHPMEDVVFHDRWRSGA